MNIFRRDHCIRLLTSLSTEVPLDLQLKRYFNLHKSIGANDRRDVAESVYSIIRYEAYFKAVVGPSWTAALNAYLSPSFWKDWGASTLPLHTKYSFSPDAVDALERNYGKKTEALLKSLNSRAPLTIRTNTLKITPQKLMKRLLDSNVKVKACEVSSVGLSLEGQFNLFGLSEFKNGFFEVQDEASQLVAFKTGVAPGMTVLDLCAGSGGKSLAMGALMNNTGQLYLYDRRESILKNARLRCKRAGLQNYQVTENLQKQKGKMDLVLVDAPCSGSGTYRRSPDQKLKFTMRGLQELNDLQFSLLSTAVSCLKPEGRIVYSTCSLLAEENQHIVKQAEEKLGLRREGDFLQTTPLQHSMDGFFCAVLVRSDSSVRQAN